MSEPLASSGGWSRLLGALPPAYLVLTIMVGGFLYYEDRVATSRAVLINRILDACTAPAQLQELGKEIAEQQGKVEALSQTLRDLENRVAGTTARLDAIDAASRAELHGARRAR